MQAMLLLTYCYCLGHLFFSHCTRRWLNDEMYVIMKCRSTNNRHALAHVLEFALATHNNIWGKFQKKFLFYYKTTQSKWNIKMFHEGNYCKENYVTITFLIQHKGFVFSLKTKICYSKDSRMFIHIHQRQHACFPTAHHRAKFSILVCSTVVMPV